MKKNVFILILFLLFTSCNLISFDDYEVSMTPGSENSWFDGDSIFLSFNCEVKHYYTETSFYLEIDGTSCEVNYDWLNDSEVKITPKEGWISGSLYQAKINGSLYTSAGATFSVNKISSFYYGDEKNQFKIINAPFNKKDVANDEILVFKFNHSVNRADFENAFTITPTTNYRVEINSAFTEYKIIPTIGWNVNQTYKWSFKTLQSKDNWLLSGNVNGEFVTIQDYSIPEVLTICAVSSTAANATWYDSVPLNENISQKMPIGIVFSKPMDFSTVKNGIIITPAITNYFLSVSTDNKKFLIVPEENINIETEYLITIDTSVKDVNGISLKEDYKEVFKSFESYLQVKKLTFNDDISNSIDLINNPVPKCIDINNAGASFDVAITFSHPIQEDMLKKVEEAISLSLVFPLSSASPVKTGCVWNNDRQIVIIKWTNITTTSDVDSYYLFKIPGGKNGVNNGKGNYVKEDICVDLKF